MEAESMLHLARLFLLCDTLQTEEIWLYFVVAMVIHWTKKKGFDGLNCNIESLEEVHKVQLR